MESRSSKLHCRLKSHVANLTLDPIPSLSPSSSYLASSSIASIGMRSRTQARALLRLTAPTRTASSSSGSSVTASSVASSKDSKSSDNGRSNGRSSLRPRSNSNGNNPFSSSSSSSSSSSFSPRSISSSSTAVTPPPTALPQLIWQSFFSAGRPLLELDALPRKVNNKNILSEDYQTNVPHWRTKASRISSARFSSLLDSLSSSDPSSSPTSTPSKSSRRSTGPHSPLVRSTSRLLHSEQAEEKDRKRAISLAIERGEDPALASALGPESDLVVLGEPNGPKPTWGKGVATFLAENTRAYQPPPPPTPATSFLKQQKLSPKSTVYLTDDDPSLMLSHALIQSSLPQALEWDRITSLMDSAALNDKSLERKGINLKAIKEIFNDKSLGGLDLQVEGEGKIMSFDQLTKEAEENGWILLAGKELELMGEEGKNQVGLDSVKRKRKTKMRKHK